MKYKVPQNQTIFNFMWQLGLYETYSAVPIRHVEDFLQASVQTEFSGKVVEMAHHSKYHRTTISHFLNKGKWDENDP